MLEFIPVSKCEEEIDVNTDKVKFLDNTVGNSIAKKYNYAIENYVLKSDENTA